MLGKGAWNGFSFGIGSEIKSLLYWREQYVGPSENRREKRGQPQEAACPAAAERLAAAEQSSATGAPRVERPGPQPLQKAGMTIYQKSQNAREKVVSKDGRMSA